jgi:hypothetical protein
MAERFERRVANGQAGEKQCVVIGRGGVLRGEMPEEADGKCKQQRGEFHRETSEEIAGGRAGEMA